MRRDETETKAVHGALVKRRPTTENQRFGMTLITISKFYFGYHTPSIATALKDGIISSNSILKCITCFTNMTLKSSL